MPYKNKEDRKRHYDMNKDKINEVRRLYSSHPDVKQRIRLNDKKWRDEHREILNTRNVTYSKKYRQKVRDLVFNHYGRKCFCCGEDIIEFLSIDHKDGGGTQHRKKIKRHLNVWLVNNNFPEGFQTLCFNCNWGKHINGGICPHKSK